MRQSIDLPPLTPCPTPAVCGTPVPNATPAWLREAGRDVGVAGSPAVPDEARPKKIFTIQDAEERIAFLEKQLRERASSSPETVCSNLPGEVANVPLAMAELQSALAAAQQQCAAEAEARRAAERELERRTAARVGCSGILEAIATLGCRRRPTAYRHTECEAPPCTEAE